MAPRLIFTASDRGQRGAAAGGAEEAAGGVCPARPSHQDGPPGTAG